MTSNRFDVVFYYQPGIPWDEAGMSEDMGTRTVLEPFDTFSELRREHDFAQPLLAHLAQLRERLVQGPPPSPREVHIGVALLDVYLHRVHVHQEDREVFPEAMHSMPGSCRSEVRYILEAHGEMQERSQRLLTHLHQWDTTDVVARHRLGEELNLLLERDRRMLSWEDAHTLGCVQAAVTWSVRQAFDDRIAAHQQTLRAVQGRIARYLNGTYST